MKCPDCGRCCTLSPKHRFWECRWCGFSVLIEGSGYAPEPDDYYPGWQLPNPVR